MRHALALSSVVLAALALTAACAETPSHGMQPDPATGYAVETTGAQVVGVDQPSTTNAPAPTGDAIAMRLAAEICTREVRCHAAAGNPPARGTEECWQASLDRTRRELGRWRCSPAGMRARAEECLASIGNEPCDHDLGRRRSLCASNLACGYDSILPPSAP